MIRPISTKSSVWRPRVASAGVPIRSPLETAGGRGSNGTALRLTVIPTAASRSSACLPSSSDSRRSHSTRWTSVPPVSTLTPPPAPSSSAATALAPASVRQPLGLVHVDQARLRVHVIGGDVVQPPGEVDLHPVGEMAAVRQLEPEQRVARLHQGVEGGRVGLGARVRLHVGVLGAEQ